MLTGLAVEVLPGAGSDPLLLVALGSLMIGLGAAALFVRRP
jgi:hypothetical protein